MSPIKILEEVKRALRTLQSSLPDRIARTEAEMTLDKLLRRVDEEAQLERDVIEPKREVDGDIIYT